MLITMALGIPHMVRGRRAWCQSRAKDPIALRPPVRVDNTTLDREVTMRRRDAIKGMTAGVAATFVGARVVRAAADAGAAPAIVSSEHWAKKGDVSLYMFRKR